MNRIEVNVITGEITVIPLTQEEIDAAAIATAIEKAKPKPVDLVQLCIDELASKADASQEIKDRASKK